MNFKNVLIAIGITAFALPLMLGCGAPAPTTVAEETVAAETPTPAAQEAEFLFVQSATSSNLADGVLTLGGVSDATIYFSDRPERLAGHLTTEEFIGNWGSGDDSFASDPPNATLSILAGEEPQEIVVTINNPRLEGDDLIYDVEILEGSTAAVGGASSLFIDIIGRPLTPVSYAGVARRTTRRAIIY